MKISGKALLQRLGAGESILSVCQAAGISREEFDAWWQRERVSAPDLFVEEFGAALERLAMAPSAGPVYVGGHRRDLRRLLLPRTRYHVYYLAEEDRVAVTPFRSGFRVGSTMEFAGYDATLDRDRLGLLTAAADRYLREPPTGPAVEEWWGWRPMTPDGMQVLLSSRPI